MLCLNVLIGHCTRAKALNLMMYIFFSNFLGIPMISPLPFIGPSLQVLRGFYCGSSTMACCSEFIRGGT
jgi:hypothetical protein